MRRTWVAESLVLITPMLLGLPGCGGSGADHSAAGQPRASSGTSSSGAIAGGAASSLDPCQLVTRQQVADAVGMSVDAGKAASQEAAGSRGCTWDTAYGDKGGGPDSIASITVEVMGPNPAVKSQFPTARSYYDFLRNQLYASRAEDVSGIGDAAFFSSSRTWLWAVKGNAVLRVFATLGDTATVKPVLQQLMKEALGKT